MTSREHIVKTIQQLYAARKDGDVEACMKMFSDDACFVWAGSPETCPVAHESVGSPAVREAVANMVGVYQMTDYSCRDILVDGERAAVLADVSFRFTPTGETFSTQLYDLWTFKDGQVASLIQFGDTALAARHAEQARAMSAQ